MTWFCVSISIHKFGTTRTVGQITKDNPMSSTNNYLPWYVFDQYYLPSCTSSSHKLQLYCLKYRSIHLGIVVYKKYGQTGWFLYIQIPINLCLRDVGGGEVCGRWWVGNIMTHILKTCPYSMLTSPDTAW